MAKLARIEAQGYFLRSLRPEDATQAIVDALNSAEVRRWLNMPPITFTLQSLMKFLSLFDGETRHILGIFTPDAQCVGLYTLDVQRLHDTAILTTAIWDAQAMGRGVLLLTMNELLDHFYAATSLRKISCRIDRQNWRIFSNLLPQLHDPKTYRPRFHYEGTLWSEFKRADGTRMDAMIFASYHPDMSLPRRRVCLS